MRRRRLLEGMLAATGLYASQALIGATSAHAASFEGASDASDALANTTRALHEICVEHMTGAAVEVSQVKALAAWRDALSLKINAPAGPRHARAAEMEGRAAGLVAMFYGDMGDRNRALRWYLRADVTTNCTDVRAWLFSCRAWVPMFDGNGEGVVKAAARALALVPYSNPVQKAFAFNQLARGYAIEGDNERALGALADADRAFSAYGYYGRLRAPSLDHFSKWQHAAYAADTYSMIGEVSRARNARLALADMPYENGMNKVIREVGEARCLVVENEPEQAVHLVRRTLTGLNEDDVHTAVVQGKAKLFVAGLPEKMADTRDVREFREYLAAA